MKTLQAIKLNLQVIIYVTLASKAMYCTYSNHNLTPLLHP